MVQSANENALENSLKTAVDLNLSALLGQGTDAKSSAIGALGAEICSIPRKTWI